MTTLVLCCGCDTSLAVRPEVLFDARFPVRGTMLMRVAFLNWSRWPVDSEDAELSEMLQNIIYSSGRENKHSFLFDTN